MLHLSRILTSLVGNAVTDDYHDYIGTFEYWWTHGLISNSTYRVLRVNCNLGSSQHPSGDCIRALNLADAEQGNIDPYSIYTRPCNSTSDLKHKLKGHYPWMSRAYDPCTERHSKVYFNLPEVQKALHANVTGILYSWDTCSDILGDYWDDSPKSMLPIYQELIKAGIRIWVFRWITSSVARGVIDIHLDFHYDKFYGTIHDPLKLYAFHGQQVASTIRHLHLKFCKLHLPPDFTGFTSLVSLSLYSVNITPALLENFILPQCPLPEFLSLNDCLHPDKLSYKFSGTSLRLKHLHKGTTMEIASIEVHDINLLSFELLWDVPKLSIENAPHLASHPQETCDVPHPYLLNNLKRLVFVSRSRTHLLGVLNVLKLAIRCTNWR